jgi:hypothetical protein
MRNKRKQKIKIHLLRKAKWRAQKYSLPFTIDENDINITEFCPVLGIPLIIGEGSYNENSPSIDKRIPNLGYIKGNVRIISHRANTLKNNATVEELELILEDAKRINSKDKG